jgi:uroporphyrinogen III methyltransferase/synthase
MTAGKVYLVGAGPGDPGLFTLRGRTLLDAADVVVYDYLAARALLADLPDDIEKIYVGKKGGDHTLSQEGINSLLVEKARAGNMVVRLKGGDPFIFGRGGEEAEVLAAAGIAFEVVPGVTSAIAAPAYAGIPLTHRQFTSTLAFVTGHEDPRKESSSIDWAALARGIGTVVFFMGVKNLPHIVDRLRENGMPPERPVALVRWGTTPEQVVVTGTLETIVAAVERAGLKAPAIIVVGEVVGLRDTMKWFEQKPLFGRRIVVTRAREQASDLVQRLASLGARCIECPTIRIVPEEDATALDAAIGRLATYDWIVFTSVNGVRIFFKRLFGLGRDARALGGLQTAAIGPSTARAMLEYGVSSDIVPDNYRAEAVVKAFAGRALTDRRVLLPRARDARPVLPQELTRQGAVVDEVVTYHAAPAADSEALRSALSAGEIDMVTFTSSSTVTNFNALLPPEESRRLMAGVQVAAIGPVTADTARECGFEVAVSAATYTIDGLCDAILEHFRSL